jgi:hypothetical protein
MRRPLDAFSRRTAGWLLLLAMSQARAGRPL